jgi:hypothetical protein
MLAKSCKQGNTRILLIILNWLCVNQCWSGISFWTYQLIPVSCVLLKTFGWQSGLSIGSKTEDSWLEWGRYISLILKLVRKLLEGWWYYLRSLSYQVGTGLKLANIAWGHTSLVGSKCYQYWYQCWYQTQPYIPDRHDWHQPTVTI